MSLRLKAFALLTLFAAIATGITLAVVHRYIYPSIEELEREAAVRHVQQIIRTIEHEETNLARLSSSWAAWEDTLQFVRQPAQGFLHEDLVLGHFEEDDFHFFALFDRDANLLWGRVYDLPGAADIAVPEALLGGEGPAAGAGGAAERGGLFDSGRGPALIESRPVVDEHGAVVGLLVIVKILDQPALESIGRLAGVAFEILAIDALPPALRTPLAGAGGGTAFVVTPVDQELLRVDLPLTDIFGAPVFALRAEVPRDIGSIADEKLLTALAYGAGGGAVLLLIMLLAFEAVLFRPISLLGRRVKAAARSAQGRVDLSRQDELGQIARDIDRVLEAHWGTAEAPAGGAALQSLRRVLHDARNALLPVISRVDHLMETSRDLETGEMSRAIEELAAEDTRPDRRAKLLDYLRLKARDLDERRASAAADLDALSKRIANLEEMLSAPSGGTQGPRDRPFGTPSGR